MIEKDFKKTMKKMEKMYTSLYIDKRGGISEL